MRRTGCLRARFSQRCQGRPAGRRAARLLAIGVLTLGVGGGGSGCGGEVRRSGAGWVAVRDTLGDTVVVRTVHGSVWGTDAQLVEEVRVGRLDGPDEYTFGDIIALAVDSVGAIYVSDRQTPALRKYGPDGAYLATFGRRGGGPGEYERPDGGLAVLPDGRVLLRDPANGRIDVYGPDGEYVTEWRIQGGMYTRRPPFKNLWVDLDGRVWVQLSTKGERVPAAERESGDGAGPGTRSEFQARWREPVAFDVFEPDGRLLGTVQAGFRVRAYPQPVARGDHLWAVEVDELGVPSVVRYRIVRGEAETAEGD
ncbi:MAG: hypothetical protein ACE5HQ_00265 [Gemmatimonadota bacterium]